MLSKFGSLGSGELKVLDDLGSDDVFGRGGKREKDGTEDGGMIESDEVPDPVDAGNL
jgi:hypothetical protein